MLHLVGLPFSGWTEKARWALDHHRVSYRFEEYTPGIETPILRARSGKWRGPISVPVLLEPGRAVFDSFAIARRAEEIGGAAPLFPDGVDMPAWNERSERGLSASRGLFLPGLLADDEALGESLPRFVPDALGAIVRPMTKAVVGGIARKYAAEAPRDEHVAAVRRELVALRDGLAGKPYIAGDRLSYADIAMAVVLGFVSPIAEGPAAMRPATRRAATQADLAGEFSDLVAWRDALYAKHREAARN